ncbi:MAG: glycosyltransferase [Sphingobacteriia bacterium]|nr:glycosyltransferase [Sphingobacteriia bacterium]
MNTILNITYHNSEGGVKVSFINFAKTLKEFNYKVYNIVPNKKKFSNSLDNIISNPFVRYARHVFSPFSTIYFFIILRILKPKFIFIHNGKLQKIIHLTKPKNCKVIGVNHGISYKKLFLAEHIITFNNKIKDEYLKNNFTNVSVIHHPLSYIPQNILPKNITNKEQVVIGSLGRLDKEKGYEFFIDVIFELHKILKQKFKVIIGGNGPLNNSLKTKIYSLNLEETIELLDWIENKEAFFKSLDIFCLPSKFEAYGLVVTEAMSYGIPVIATNTPGPEFIIQNEKNGLLVNYGNAKEFAEKILYLINEKEEYKTISTNSINFIKEHSTLENFRKNLSDILFT